MSLPSGVTLLLNFITPDEESELIAYVDEQPWSNALKRRTQHYGYLYQYARRRATSIAPPISGPLLQLGKRLEEFFGRIPNQCIVNEYLRDQGISAHIDSSDFGPVIATVSLQSDTMMRLHSPNGEMVEVFLHRCSLLLLSGEARWLWKHEIPCNVTYHHPILGRVSKPAEYRRISLTYRTLG